MYRAGGPEELRPVGRDRIRRRHSRDERQRRLWRHAGRRRIVGFADLTLGERVEAVLEAQIRAGGGRFRGVRHSGNWDADPVIGNGAPGPDIYRRARFPGGPGAAVARSACRWMPGCSSRNWRM